VASPSLPKKHPGNALFAQWYATHSQQIPFLPHGSYVQVQSLRFFSFLQSSCGEADRNTDGVIDISEIISYVGKWRNGQVSLQDVMAAIIVWKT